MRGRQRVADQCERRACVRPPATTAPTAIVTRLGGTDQLVLAQGPKSQREQHKRRERGEPSQGGEFPAHADGKADAQRMQEQR